MPEIPFAIQWTIPENRLLPMKDSINNEYLVSSVATNIPGFEYYLGIVPNGDKEDRRGQTWIFLFLNLKNAKMVAAKWNDTIESANYSESHDFIYEKDVGAGKKVCATKDFFDAEKKFIVDGKCTVKINGTFKFENPGITEIGQEQKWDGGEVGQELWEKDETKDFTIIVDGKDIKVHKLILDARSSVFSAMLNTKLKESIENKVIITDFSFNVVEAAIKMIYHCNFVTALSLNERMSLLQFFDKYNLPTLKNKVEQPLMDQISAATVCRLTNCSILTNSEKLKNQCITFLEAAFFQTKTPLADFEILDKEIAFKILQNSFYQNLETK